MKLVKRPLLLLSAYLVFSALTLCMLFYSVQPQDEDSTYTYNQARLLVNAILQEVEDNYLEIGESAFAARIQSHLTDIGANLEVVDTSGRVLYDSQVETAHLTRRTVDLKTYLHYDASFAAQHTGLVRFTFPLTQDGVQAANAIFLLPRDRVWEAPPNPARMLLPVAAALAAILLAFIMLQHRFAKTVRRPLDRLNSAVRELIRGNYDCRLNFADDGELRQICQSLDIMRLELKDSLAKQRDYDQARKELITKISHDLKTPVSSIKAYVEGLQDGMAKDPATADKYLAVISRKTDSLVRLIDDLLQHSLQELGQMRILKQELYSKSLLEQILQPIIVQFENSSISFIVEDDLPNVLINADPTRLEQVIVNLVQNAMKYTADGGEIVFSAKPQGSCLEISVADTGAGVSPQDLPHIFDSFYRSQQFARDIEGAGLGLAICKYIVEEHGGKIWVESKLNLGSTFSFTIAKA